MVKKESGAGAAPPLATPTASTGVSSSPHANHFYEVSPHAATPPTLEAGSSQGGSGGSELPFEYFMPGARVKCTTCFGDVVEGEVMAFDLNTRMLVLKMPATDRRTSHNDVQMLNMNFMKDVKLLSEAKNNNGAQPADPPTLNIQRLKTRIGQNLERKGRLIKAFKSGVSSEGQRLFQVISKTIDEIEWEGENIVVMRKVTIMPPYKPENIKGVSDSKAVLHITKIVEKHVEDERDSTAKANQSRNSSVSPAKSASPPQSGGARAGGTGGKDVVATPVVSQQQQTAPPSVSAASGSSSSNTATAATSSSSSTSNNATPTSGSSAPSQAGPTQTNNSNSSNSNQRNTNGPRQQQSGGQDRRANNSNSHASSTSNNSGRNGPSGAGNPRSATAAKPIYPWSVYQ